MLFFSYFFFFKHARTTRLFLRAQIAFLLPSSSLVFSGTLRPRTETGHRACDGISAKTKHQGWASHPHQPHQTIAQREARMEASADGKTCRDTSKKHKKIQRNAGEAGSASSENPNQCISMFLLRLNQGSSLASGLHTPQQGCCQTERDVNRVIEL